MARGAAREAGAGVAGVAGVAGDHVNRPECTICACEEESNSIALAFARGLSLGLAIQKHDSYNLYLRECLCLRHCDLIQHHRAWSERNAGKCPPWDEKEPGS